MPCLLASCAVVSSPRSASRATFALKSAEYRCRLPVIQVRPSQEQTELNLLSEFPGPPQSLGVRGPLEQMRIGLVALDKSGEGFDAEVGERHNAIVARAIDPDRRLVEPIA